MCGFLAEFRFNDNEITSKYNFTNLLSLSKHRGPDDTEVVRHKNFQLGFNRLSILDLSPQGSQPKQSPSGRYYVVFNGEIYNYKDLEKSHNLHNLRSTSDTEILVQLLDKIGIKETINSLNGMFAIAIVDTQENDIYLSRDFAGIKPLFYGISNKGIVAASQFNQIFKHNWFSEDLHLQLESVKEYFGFGYMQAPNTVFKNIYQVEPGELLQINDDGKVKRVSLIEFNKDINNSGLEEKFVLKQVLEDAVNKQLVSDVPVATFLSGGIDSPLVSAYAKKGKPNIEAFTLKVNNSKLNESDIALKYAEYLNLKQHIVIVNQNDLLKNFDKLFLAFPEPFGDYSSIPTFEISKEAKKNHTVMLSGDGGDELFFGYPRMLDVLNKRLWFKVPYYLRIFIIKITNRVGITNTWAPYFKDLNAFITSKHLKIPENILNRMLPKVSFSRSLRKLYTFNNKNRKELLHQLRWNEFYGHLQRILIKVDRASMAHSLEVRVPLLDKDSIASAWSLSRKLNSNDDLKKELKELLAKEVPIGLINMKKMGFSVPMYEWLHGELKEDVSFYIFEKPFYGEPLLDSNVLKQFTQNFFDKKHHNSWGVWHIYSWQKWATMHVIN